MSAVRGAVGTTRTFTCAACSKEQEVPFSADGRALVDTSGWTTHGFTNPTGRIDKVVTIYTCSNACARRALATPAPPIVQEALDWLALGDDA